MNLCDSNIWLALALNKHHLHSKATDWVEELDEPGTLLFCRATQQSLIRLLTTASVMGAYGSAPLTNKAAWELCESFVQDDRIVFVGQEPAGLEERWRQFSTRDTKSPKLWMDAYLAAFAVSGGYTIVTNDVGYRQFKGLELLLL